MPASTLLNIKDALARSTAWLAEKGIPPARLDAEVLLAHVLGMSRLDLYLAWDRPLNEDEKGLYRALLQRRSEFEPVAYITGKREFFSLEFRVTPDVLVPRPETELLVEEALELAKAMTGDREARPPRIADVGTGSGAVVIALATHLPGARFVATDVSAAALAVAAENAQTHGVGGAIEFRKTSLLDDVEGPFDLVASNPPYVAERDRASLPPDVARHEPAEALFAGEDGLDVISALIPSAAERLRPGGWMAVEIGAGQIGEVARLLEENGCFERPRVKPDYQGIERVVSARRRAA